MYNFYITQDGEITRDGNTLYFVGKDFKRHLPVMNVNEIIISAKVSISSWALDYLSKLGIMVHILNIYGNYMSSLIPGNRNEKGNIIIMQVRSYLNDDRLYIASQMVLGIKHNILRNLRYYNKNNALDDKIEKISGYYPDGNNINSILGTEGNIWSTYYSAFPYIYKKYHEFKREFHPPKDELNAMISFGNSLLYSNVITSIFLNGLNPSISYLHEPSERSFSLALDISDIFKPVIVERVIANLVNNNIIDSNHFTKENNGYYLNDNGRKIFINYYNQKMNSTINIKGNYVSYSRVIDMEVQKLIRHLKMNEKYIPFKSGD
ncbi:type I-B CRISPR-associated endonuclease Cas1b [Picrophilus oshimae]|uniref:CRISPR-associated endonuclease Cas1 n=1 Tax=Picrophilus torridus (strain ATCC 700027 / DSM 9790 / JCM 10055 / NBRC 100828 / KAW 2/3) TaxID=1122961 RepID=Q6L317_PICTO|nr:type I-B CRISPR-associated endonuclease Cas1b [Picrophilus oshimae]AAT42634.1 DNA polymerase [Picrophilus oshimae DSM 9789]